jgi:hypothetical protein
MRPEGHRASALHPSLRYRGKSIVIASEHHADGPDDLVYPFGRPLVEDRHR